jgi:cytochrome c peroxidase
MTHRYVYSIIVALVAVLAILAAYALYKRAPADFIHNRIPTEFDFIEVSGPIQPIPRLKSIDKDWLELGKALFNSTLLSHDNSVSCASCHTISQGGDDGFPMSIGIKGAVGGRNSPTVLNSVFSFRQFWDGRSSDLAEQAVGPIHNPIEMGSNFPEIISKLNQSEEFVAAFKQVSTDGITSDAIVQAIVTFEESLITPNSAIDQYIKGNDSALNSQQKKGYKKFIALGCVSCHQGVNIGGNLYQRIGRIDHVPEKLLQDKGRFEITKNKNDEFVFKVPSLRNIARTAPYFHNGSVETLEEAVKIMASGQLGIDLTKQDVEDLMALFEAFNGELP